MPPALYELDFPAAYIQCLQFKLSTCLHPTLILGVQRISQKLHWLSFRQPRFSVYSSELHNKLVLTLSQTLTCPVKIHFIKVVFFMPYGVFLASCFKCKKMGKNHFVCCHWCGFWPTCFSAVFYDGWLVWIVDFAVGLGDLSTKMAVTSSDVEEMLLHHQTPGTFPSWHRCALLLFWEKYCFSNPAKQLMLIFQEKSLFYF